MTNFAQRFAKARKDCKMTQTDVAERLNVSFQAVGLWERGETLPEIDKLPEIATIFQVTADWLLMGKEENPLVIDIQENLSDRLFNEDRMYTYVKTYATIKQMHQTIKVLPYARNLR